MEWSIRPTYGERYWFVKQYNSCSELAEFMNGCAECNFLDYLRMETRTYLINRLLHRNFSLIADEYENELPSLILNYIGCDEFEDKEWIWDTYGADYMVISQLQFVRYLLNFGLLTADVNEANFRNVMDLAQL